MKELSEEIYTEIMGLCEQGDALVENSNYNAAIEKFKHVLELVPLPKDDWEASTWIYTTLGDTYFLNADYKQARECLFEALNCPDGIINPFILIRLGESLYECGEIERAKEYLLRSYMLEGQAIFEEEDEKYLEIISDII